MEKDNEEEVALIRQLSNGDLVCLTSNSAIENSEDVLSNPDLAKESDEAISFDIADITIQKKLDERAQVSKHSESIPSDVLKEDGKDERQYVRTTEEFVSTSVKDDTNQDVLVEKNAEGNNQFSEIAVQCNQTIVKKRKVRKNIESANQIKNRRRSITAPIGDESRHLFEKSIPEGWSRKAVQRQNGASAGKYDVYIFSPSGVRFRSGREIATYLYEEKITTCSAEDFQFSVSRAVVRKVVNNLPKASTSSSNVIHGTKQANKTKDTVNRAALPSTKSSKTSSALLDKLIPPLSDGKSFISSSLFSVPHKRKISSTHNKSSRKIKFEWKGKNSKRKVISIDPSIPSTSKMGGYSMVPFDSHNSTSSFYKKRFNNKVQIKRLKPKAKSALNKFEKHDSNEVKKGKGRGRPRKVVDTNPQDADFTVLELQEERELIKEIPSKNLIVSLVKCDVSTTPSTSNKVNEEVVNNSNESAFQPNDLQNEIKYSASKWIPPESPYKLIYEQLYSQPWQLLVATIIIKASSAQVGNTLVWKLLQQFPTFEELKKTEIADLEKLVHAVDNPEKCAKKIVNFAKEFNSKAWLYPIELSSIGKYGNDAYRIFCIPEWRDVKPQEYDLSIYHNWLSQNHVILEV